jgi:dihydrodipicolinate synthase/N-acetylneuraminate lyase
VISVVAVSLKNDVKKMITAFEKGDTAGAREVHLKLLPLMKGYGLL